MRFVLASQSFQRKKILEKMGLSFEVIPAHIDEHHAGFSRPHAIVKSIAFRKAEALSQKYPDCWIIAADTIVILPDGTIALKPKNKAEAKKVIQTYRNNHCDVYSGLALVNQKKNVHLKGCEKSTIWFGDFSDEQIDDYLRVGEWRRSSGSLTIEEVGDWVKRIEGDYATILGLPVNLLKRFLFESEVISPRFQCLAFKQSNH